MIRFDYPEVFLLAIPLALAFRRWGWTRGPTGWLRAGMAILLLAAMAIPRLNRSGPGSDVVVVVDLSRSMPSGSRPIMRDLIKDIEASRGTGDRIAVVAFGQQPVVERELSETAYFSEFTQPVSADGSDLNEALLTALDRHSDPNRPMRVLVLSDGEYNGASPLYAARRARDRSVPIDYRSFEKPIAGDWAVESLSLPRDISPNEPFQFSVMVYADQESASTVIVQRDGLEIARRSADLRPGLNRLNFRDWVSDGGLHQYAAELDVLTDASQRPLRDANFENNRASGVVRVVASPKLLLITHDGQPGNVGRALTAGKIPFDAVAPSQHPLTLDALEGYRAVILENVSAESIGRVRMEHLAQYVEDLGRGLLMTGGRQSYGTGGYYQSPLDPILPVAMFSQEDQRRSRVALAIVLDRSGSMAVPVAGNRNKMDLANLASAECIKLLSAEDMVAVIAVDSQPHVIQPMTRVSNSAAIRNRVLRIESMGGGIFVYVGLVAAGRELVAASEYKTRHVVLFSDAADSEEPGDYRALLEKFSKAGITVSVIGLGNEKDSDAQLLKDIAKAGNGNIMFSSDALDLPRLFTQETMNIARNMFLTRESEDAPNGFPGRVLQDFRLLGEFAPSEFPNVDGYNLTYLKPDATLGTVSTDENRAPWSAFWFRGLGRTAAIALEVDGPFSGKLSSWDRYEDFIITHARWLMGTGQPEDVFVSLSQDGMTAVVRVELDPHRADPTRGQTPTLVVVPPDDERSDPIEPALTWVGADSLEGRFRLDRVGTYRTLVKMSDRKFAPGPLLTLPYSPEFMPRVGLPSGPDALRAMADTSGGRSRVDVREVLTDPPIAARILRSLTPLLCLCSMILLLAEIAGRRWSWWERLTSARAQARLYKVESSIDASAEQPRIARHRNWIAWGRHVRRATRDANAFDKKSATPETTKERAPSTGPSQPVVEPSAEPAPSPADAFARAKHRAKKRM